MFVNSVSYRLLCLNCKGREPNSFSMVHSSENFINYSRNALISECEDILSERPCSNCGIKGRYAIWAIYCGEQPKQIHIQMTRTNGNFHVDIFDKNNNNLNL